MSFDREFSFDNYFSGQAELIIANLKALIAGEGEAMIGLWGASDSGKTHLMNASAWFARQRGIDFQLYDGQELARYDADCFELPVNCRLLAIDNLDALCGDRQWEQRFYQIINRCKDGGLNLVFTLSENPMYLNCRLADFQSRLSWGLLLQLQIVEEKDIGDLIKRRAALLGIELSNQVIAYLMAHYPRQMKTQIEILRVLDRASLSIQKKVTIPLIKQTLVDYF